MTTLHQIIEKEVGKLREAIGYGNDFVVKQINPDGLCNALSKSLHDVALATVEAVKVEEKPIMVEDIKNMDYEYLWIKVKPIFDKEICVTDGSMVALQATKAEEFINGK